jgi:Streptomyces sporulation and cell division protein, SsgA
MEQDAPETVFYLPKRLTGSSLVGLVLLISDRGYEWLVSRNQPPATTFQRHIMRHKACQTHTNKEARQSGTRQGKGLTPMMNSSATVSAELGLSLVVPEHGVVPLVASLYYSADDPYAIRMAFHVGADEPVEWIFARELLTAGLEGHAGEGDVQVWPSDEHGRELLNLALSSPFGEAHFEAPRAATGAFLARTFEMIAEGAESEFLDVDDELDDLLWRA